jgi:hypothetical protein
MAIISGYKSKREKDGEIREIGGKKKEEEEEEENLYVGLHYTPKKRDGTGERLLYSVIHFGSVSVYRPTLVGSCGLSNSFPAHKKRNRSVNGRPAECFYRRQP